MSSEKGGLDGLHSKENITLVHKTLSEVSEELGDVEFIPGTSPPLRRITGKLLPIAKLSQETNDSGERLAPTIKDVIKRDPAYKKIKLMFALYMYTGLINDKFPESTEDQDIKTLRKIALLFQGLASHLYENEGISADWKPEAYFAPYQDERSMEDYRELLFFDISPTEFENYIRNTPPGNWLDIGSGNTYKNPNSLMSRLPDLNQKINLIGIDPLYDENHARPIDILYGRAGLDETHPNSQNLVAGTGQRLPFEKNQFNKVIIAHVFTWMNTRPQINQVLCQTVRVLIPGGELRATSIPAEIIDEPSNPLNQYFEITHRKKRKSSSTKPNGEKTTDTVYDIVAKKKILSGGQKLKLQLDIDTWLKKFPT